MTTQPAKVLRTQVWSQNKPFCGYTARSNWAAASKHLLLSFQHGRHVGESVHNFHRCNAAGPAYLKGLVAEEVDLVKVLLDKLQAVRFVPALLKEVKKSAETRHSFTQYIMLCSFWFTRTTRRATVCQPAATDFSFVPHARLVYVHHIQTYFALCLCL